METALICTKCKKELRHDLQGLYCDDCGSFFPVIESVPSFFDPSVEADSFASIEAKAHDALADMAEEFMGLDIYYFRHTHAYIFQQMEHLVPRNRKILEIGAGIGEDIVNLAQREYHDLHACDVSLRSVIKAWQLAEKKGVGNHISFYHLDGLNLPFKEEEFDVIFLVSSLHHFPVIADILTEMKRCCKPGGYLMSFIEPNRLYYQCVRPLAKLAEKGLSPWRRHQDWVRSIAEEKAEGFTISSFYELARQIGLEVVTIKSHWVLTEFVYLFQQFCFRILGKLPLSLLNTLSKITCAIDDRLTQHPISFCWHYSIIYRIP